MEINKEFAKLSLPNQEPMTLPVITDTMEGGRSISDPYEKIPVLLPMTRDLLTQDPVLLPSATLTASREF